MAKNLLIVESPAKSKTLKKFLGKDFDIMATVGHVIDLPKSKIGIDVEKTATPNRIFDEDCMWGALDCQDNELKRNTSTADASCARASNVPTGSKSRKESEENVPVCEIPMQCLSLPPQ